MINLHKIHSLSDFKQNAKSYVSQLQSRKEPLVLTVNGEAIAVMEDDEFSLSLRSFVKVNHIIFYQTSSIGINVFRVLHHARDLESLL